MGFYRSFTGGRLRRADPVPTLAPLRNNGARPSAPNGNACRSRSQPTDHGIARSAAVIAPAPDACRRIWPRASPTGSPTPLLGRSRGRLRCLLTGITTTASRCSLRSPSGVACSASPAATTATSRKDLQDEPALPVRARAARHRCNQRARSGGRSLHRHPSPRVRRSRRRSFAEARLLLFAPGLDLRQALAGDAPRPDPGLREIPANPVAEPLALRPRRRARGRVLGSAAAGPVLGFFLSTTLPGTRPTRSTRVAPVRHAPLRDRRHQPDNWALRAAHLGEGWHKQPPHYMASARRAFRWWEVDVTYYLLRALATVGVIWDVRERPRR